MLGDDVVLNSGSISSPSYCWTREVNLERLNLLWPCVQDLEELCGKQKSSLYERGHFLLLFYWDVSSQPRTWKTLKLMWLSQTLRVSFLIFFFMNQLHFQRVWGGTAAHKELWRWHFGYPGTTVTCKGSQFYVCGENIKFYEVMVSNITKDISLLAWNSDIHPSKVFAWGLPKLTLSSFVPQSCLIPESSAFILSPRYVQLKVWLFPSCPCTSRAVTALALFSCQIHLQYLRWECVFPSPRVVPVLRERGVFLIQISFKLKTSMRVPLPSFLRLISGGITSPLLPCLPGTVTSECLSLFQAYCPGIFWPRACRLCFSGWSSFPGTCRQLGAELGIESVLLESQWNAQPAVAAFPLLEDLPEEKHSAEAVVETLGATSGMHPFIFGPVKEGHLWKWYLSSASRVPPAWSAVFWINMKPNCGLRISLSIYQFIFELG